MFRNPTTDLIVLLVIVLLIFGPKRLPGLGKSLGQGMREFKESISGDSKDEHEEKPAIPARAPVMDSTPGTGPERAPSSDRESAEVSSERHS